ncbi:hypothetical protein OG21DRAFT_1425032 [Imleria badia]|nr:hypothetical protein OG21DRAFT_1425032 [Imleria badia]
MTQRKELGLRQCELTDDEWRMLKDLHNVLKVLKNATTFFSQATPNLATMIPAMDLINGQLTKYSHNASLSPAICAGVSMAKHTLNHYYSLTDSSEVYRIAMILHPHHKLNYL